MICDQTLFAQFQRNYKVSSWDNLDMNYSEQGKIGILSSWVLAIIHYCQYFMVPCLLLFFPVLVETLLCDAGIETMLLCLIILLHPTVCYTQPSLDFHLVRSSRNHQSSVTWLTLCHSLSSDLFIHTFHSTEDPFPPLTSHHSQGYMEMYYVDER